MDDDDKTGALFVSPQQPLQVPMTANESPMLVDGPSSGVGSAQLPSSAPGQALSTALMVNQMLAVQQHQHSETMSSLTSVLQDKDERIRDLEGSLGTVQEKVESLTSTMESQQKLVRCFVICLVMYHLA
jgi:hypothetical protein